MAVFSLKPNANCTDPLPRLPVFGWHTFRGGKGAVPRVIDDASLTPTTSGRAAILLALQTLGVGVDSRVLVPTYHCPTMVAPAAVLGATPMFYPINARGGADLSWLRAADTRGVRAMLAAHFFGIPQPMSQLRAFCDARGIALIEDCAHAFFGCSEGRVVGSWGDFAIASLTKFFPVNEGGLLLTHRARRLITRPRARGMKDEARALIDALETGAKYSRLNGANQVLSWASRIKRRLRSPAPDAHAPKASIYDAELIRDRRTMTRTAQWIWRHARAERIVELRRHNYRQLVAMLSGTPGMAPLMPRLPIECAPYVMPLLVDEPDALYHALRAAGIPVFRWCQVWPGTPHIEGDYGAQWATRVLQLGCHQDLAPQQIEFIADTVKRLARQCAAS